MGGDVDSGVEYFSAFANQSFVFSLVFAFITLIIKHFITQITSEIENTLYNIKNIVKINVKKLTWTI